MKLKHIGMTIACILLSGLAAIAQKPDNPPSASQDTKPSTQSPDMSPSSTQTSASAATGEQTLQGCIGSQDGKYMLQSSGQSVPLTGTQDFASHVGHSVTVHGTYGNGSTDASKDSTTTSTSTGSSTGSSPQFTVTKIDMVSESCTADKGNSGPKQK